MFTTGFVYRDSIRQMALLVYHNFVIIFNILCYNVANFQWLKNKKYTFLFRKNNTKYIVRYI